jgi:hypothetical protein
LTAIPPPPPRIANKLNSVLPPKFVLKAESGGRGIFLTLSTEPREE